MKAHQLSPVKIPLTRLASAKVPFTAGIFILYRTNMGAPAFIGRSDARLYDAINDYLKSPIYHYFKFMQCSDATDAYQWHCMFWHKGLATIDNASTHPHTPPHGNKMTCPFPGCAYVHLESVQMHPEDMLQ
jgi:hypothetical protein